MGQASIFLTPAEQIPCVLVDISRNGARLLLNEPRDLPKSFVLDMSGNIVVRRLCSLVWQEGLAAGVTFPELDKAQSQQFGLK
jgi:hypothetical protein